MFKVKNDIFEKLKDMQLQRTKAMNEYTDLLKYAIIGIEPKIKCKIAYETIYVNNGKLTFNNNVYTGYVLSQFLYKCYEQLLNCVDNNMFIDVINVNREVQAMLRNTNIEYNNINMKIRQTIGSKRQMIINKISVVGDYMLMYDKDNRRITVDVYNSKYYYVEDIELIKRIVNEAVNAYNNNIKVINKAKKELINIAGIYILAVKLGGDDNNDDE